MERVLGKEYWIHNDNGKHWKEIKTNILSDSNLGDYLSWDRMWLALEILKIIMGNYIAFSRYCFHIS